MRLDGAASALLPQLEQLLNAVDNGKAGVRLTGIVGLSEGVDPARLGGLISDLIGNRHPVRATLFDKNEAANWSLGWHQDRTIAVKRKHDVAGFGPWSRKAGVQHVEPPFGIIERMVTARFHLDDVDKDNAPLLIATGSHNAGKIAETRIEEVVGLSGTITCLAQRGDVWIYSTPILHASQPSRRPRRRRVLQVDYSADTLPGSLQWAGV